MSNLEELNSDKVSAHKITEGTEGVDSIEDPDRIVLLVSNVSKEEFESIKGRFTNMIGYTLLYVEDVNAMSQEEIDTVLPTIDGFLSKDGTLTNPEVISQFEGVNKPFFCYSVEDAMNFDFDPLVKGLLTKKMSKITSRIKDTVCKGLQDELFDPSNLDSLRDYVIGLFDSKDETTKSHIQNVFYFSQIMIAGLSAMGKGLDNPSAIKLQQAALLHDLTKLVIPDQLLKNSDPFSPTEYGVMKMHVNMITTFDLLGTAAKATAMLAQQHHYTYGNNAGYGPEGEPILKGEDIDPVGRMLCVIDSFEAMSAIRPYNNNGKSVVNSFEILYHNSRPFNPNDGGTGQFDPFYAGAFVLGFKTMFENDPNFRQMIIDRERSKGVYGESDTDEMIEESINSSLDSTIDKFGVSPVKKEEDTK